MAAKKPLGLYAGELEGFTAGDFIDIQYGGTGGTTQVGAQTALGLLPGTNVQAHSAELAAVASLSTTGIVARTGAGTYVPRTLAGTAGRITVANGDGVSGAPTYDLATLADGGTGTLLKFTRDTYGRVSGTATPTAADIGAIADTRYVRMDAATVLNSGITISYNAATTSYGTNDLVPKSYVDLIAQGYAGNNAQVRVATVGANITLSGSAPNTLDGVTLAINDSVLVKDQTTASQNGWYTVTTVGTGSNGTWTRMSGYDTTAEIIPGTFTFVNEGTVNADNGFVLTTNASITLNTTSLAFVQNSGAGQIVAGNGITKSGNTLSVVTANATRIAVGGSGIDLASLAIGGSGVGTFTKFTVDTYGRVTSTATALPSDVGAQASSSELTGLAAMASIGSVHRTAAGTYTTRVLAGPAAGISITNPDGAAGNPTLVLSNDLAAIEALNGTGFYTRTGADTWAARSITGTAGRVTVSNGDGVAGAPVIDLPSGIIASPGTYGSVTVDTYGRVTAGSAAVAASAPIQQLTNMQGSSITIAQVVYADAAGAKLAKADSDTTRRAIGLVFDTTIANTGTGAIATSGSLTATTTQWDGVAGTSGGLTPNTTYWLSATTAGSITSTPPATGWIQPIGVAASATVLRIGVEGRSIKV